MNNLVQSVTLCTDPEIKTYGDGKSLVSFNGAVNKRYKKEGEANADFFKYVAFDKTADFIAKYFKKGSKMLIRGEVNNNNYTDKDGKKVYGTQIHIDTVEFSGTKADGNISSGEASAPAEQPVAKPTEQLAEQSAAKSDSTPATASYDEYDDF